MSKITWTIERFERTRGLMIGCVLGRHVNHFVLSADLFNGTLSLCGKSLHTDGVRESLYRDTEVCDKCSRLAAAYEEE